MFSPEYDDPANLGDEYGSQYGQYGAPYEQYESRNSMAGRSIGTDITTVTDTGFGIQKDFSHFFAVSETHNFLCTNSNILRIQ